MYSQTRFRSYYLPPVDGLSGWAEIVIGSNGFFASVSDYGNYAYAWRHTGVKDFREFLAGVHSDYLMSKLGQGRKEFDGDRTQALLKEKILGARREQKLSRDEARLEWEMAEALAGGVVSLEMWAQDTVWFRDSSWEDICYGPERDLQAFAKEVWPRFVTILQNELDQTRGS